MPDLKVSEKCRFYCSLVCLFLHDKHSWWFHHLINYMFSSLLHCLLQCLTSWTAVANELKHHLSFFTFVYNDLGFHMLSFLLIRHQCMCKDHLEQQKDLLCWVRIRHCKTTVFYENKWYHWGQSSRIVFFFKAATSLFFLGDTVCKDYNLKS